MKDLVPNETFQVVKITLISNTMYCCSKCRAYANFCLLLKLEHPSKIRKRILSGNMDAYEHQSNIMRSKIFHASTEFMFWLSSSHLPGLIFKTLLSRAGMEPTIDVNYITIMRCIEFSQLSPDINPSVTKENMVNNFSFYTARNG